MHRQNYPNYRQPYSYQPITDPYPQNGYRTIYHPQIPYGSFTNFDKIHSFEYLERELFFRDREFARFLKEQAFSLEEIDNLKENFSFMPDFDPQKIFNYFDTNNTGQLTLEEFEGGIRKLGIRNAEKGTFILFMIYDSSRSGLLKYNDFENMVLPYYYNRQAKEFKKAEEYNRIRNYKNIMSRTDFYMGNEYLFYIRQFFQCLIDFELDIDLLKMELKQTQYIRIDEIFKRIGSEKGDFIYKEELRNFLFDHGIYLRERQLNLLFSRYDINHSGRISFDEFQFELSPLLLEYKQQTEEADKFQFT